MTEYNAIGIFGSVKFALSDVNKTTKPSTLKSNIGKTYVEKSIPLRNTSDIVLRVEGVIIGLSRTDAQTLSEAIEADRTALIALEDGYYHSWSDGRHSINAVIETGSLTWPDEATRAQGEPYKFSFTLIQWQ